MSESGKLIVGIDDDGLILQAMGDYLTHFGYRYEPCHYTAPDCDAYKDLFEKLGDGPDIVLTDFRLPGADSGLDIIREFRKRYGANIPAILFTGDVTLKSEGDLEAEETLKLLFKPIRMNLLKDEIEALLGV